MGQYILYWEEGCFGCSSTPPLPLQVIRHELDSLVGLDQITSSSTSIPLSQEAQLYNAIYLYIAQQNH